MSNFTEYCTKFDSSKVSELRDLVEDEDIIFLGNMKGKITLFHSPKNFGGTRARSTNKVACLLGLGPKATAVLLDADEICASKKFKGAKKEDIYKVSTKEDIILLEKSKPHTLGATFIPARFLRKSILDLDSKEPDDLILEANRIRNIFANQDGNASKNEAEDHIQVFTLWLQGVLLKAIPEISYEVDPDDGKLAGFSIQRHSFCILLSITTSNHQPTEDQPSIQTKLNATLNAHAETSREANIIRSEDINRLKEKDEIGSSYR